MKIPNHVKASMDRFAKRFPVPQIMGGESGEQFEERVRQWNIRRIEQIVFDTESGEGWCAKRADPGRPIGKDSIANRQLGMTPLICWDTLMGTGTGHPTPIPDPDSIDITGQMPVPLTGRNWVEASFPIPGPEPTPEPEPEPTPPTNPVILYDENFSIRFGLGCNDVYEESQATMDPGMIGVHSARCAWDYYVGGLSQDESYTKHINEFRAVYGLAPV